MLELLKNYPIKSNENLDNQLKEFLNKFLEFEDIVIDLNKELEETYKSICIQMLICY